MMPQVARRVVRVLRRWSTLRVWTGTLLVFAVAGAVWLRCGPLPQGLLDEEDRPSTFVLDRHGETLYESRSKAGLRGEDLDSSQLPPTLVNATLAAEDARFY